MGIKQLPSGRFRLQIRRAKVKVDETYDTYEQASKALEKLMGGGPGGAALKLRGITVEDAWTMYVESRDHLEKSENTQRGEITHSKPVLKELGMRPVKSLVADDVDEFITRLVKAGRAADTVRNAVSVLSAILNHCVKKKLVSANVTIGVRRPSVEPKVRRMPAGHQGALMSVLTHEKYRYRAVARLALLVRETGARPGEWVKATWDDLDLGKRKVVFQHTKYKRMPRTVPLTNAAMALLNAQLEDVYIREVERLGASDYIFPTISREGDLVPLPYTGTMRDMKKDDLIPKSLRTHNGRHEFISTLVESSDLDDSRIMSIVGHHSPASMQIYTHARNIRFLPQLEAMEEGRRVDRMKEVAAGVGVPVELVESYLKWMRDKEAAGKAEGLSDELLYEGESIEKLQAVAEKLGSTEMERMATLLKIRAHAASKAASKVTGKAARGGAAAVPAAVAAALTAPAAAPKKKSKGKPRAAALTSPKPAVMSAANVKSVAKPKAKPGAKKRA